MRISKKKNHFQNLHIKITHLQYYTRDEYKENVEGEGKKK